MEAYDLYSGTYVALPEPKAQAPDIGSVAVMREHDRLQSSNGTSPRRPKPFVSANALTSKPSTAGISRGKGNVKMNTTAAFFFLLLGQADGSASGTNPGNVAIAPALYTYTECVSAGEAARANNQGLSYLSYTCVPAPTAKQATASVSKDECPGVCTFVEGLQEKRL